METGEIDKAYLIEYKNYLKSRYRPASINSYLLSLNRYMEWAGFPELRLRLERIQRSCSLSNALETEDYHRLLDYAQSVGKKKYYHIMKTLAGTGIRVGELPFIIVLYP